MEIPNGKLARAQKVHGVLDLGVGALAAAGVGGVLVALGAEMAGTKLPTRIMSSQKASSISVAVGEAEERAVRVLLANPDEVLLAHERLAARVDVDVGAELLALRRR